MNSIDLETKIEGLKKAIAEHEDFTGTYKSQLEQAKKDLANVNKPELTPMQLDDIQEAIEAGVSDFDFSDDNNYDKEFELDYDGRVQLSNFDFTEQQELVEMIVDKVHRLFVEATCPEESSDA